jgi:hypothetical protein
MLNLTDEQTAEYKAYLAAEDLQEEDIRRTRLVR